MQSAISWAMLSLTLFFVLFILLGALFGAMRGGKRAGLRLATVIIALTLALLITPLISRMFTGLPVINRQVNNMVSSGALGEDIAENASEMVSFMTGLATVAVNFVVFFALYFLFKSISWIVYAILARKFAPIPKKDERPENFRRHRLAGMGVGIITGFVFFAFLMIPAMGFVRGLDRVASYTPVFGTFTVAEREELDEDGFAGTLADIDETLTDANRQIQNSFFGRVSRFTGMQLFGGWGTRYLSQVRTQGVSVNVHDDIVSFGRSSRDMVALMIELDRDGDLADRMENWTERDYNALRNMVRRVFNTGVVRFSFEISDALVDIFERNNTLDDVFGDLFDNFNSYDDSDAERAEFISAGYDAIRIFTNHTSMLDDFIRVVDIMEVLFRGGLFSEFRALFDNFNNVERLEAVVDTFDENERTQDLTDIIFSMNIVRSFLINPALTSLYRVPLADLLNISRHDVTLYARPDTDWQEVSDDATQLVFDIVGSLTSISDVINGDDDIEYRLERFNVEYVAGVLNTLTNTRSIGTFTRAVINQQLNGVDLGEMSGVNLNFAIEVIQNELQGTEDVRWYELLSGIRQMAIFIINIKTSVTNDFVDVNSVEELFDNAEALLIELSQIPGFIIDLAEFLGNEYDTTTSDIVRDEINNRFAGDITIRDRMLEMFGF